MKAHKYWSLGALACMAGCFYTGFINDTGKELPTIIAFEDILEIGVNMT